MTAELEIRGATFLADDPGVVRHIRVVRGPEGAVSFVWADWHPKIPDEVRAIDTKFLIEFGHTLMPMAYDLGYHSPVPMSPWQVERGPLETSCLWLDGAGCYGDGSALNAAQLFKEWTGCDFDDEWLFEQLADYYNARFRSDGEGPLEFGEMIFSLLGLGSCE